MLKNGNRLRYTVDSANIILWTTKKIVLNYLKNMIFLTVRILVFHYIWKIEKKTWRICNKSKIYQQYVIEFIEYDKQNYRVNLLVLDEKLSEGWKSNQQITSC